MREEPAHGVDDFDARPGSLTSLLRTFVGLHVRELGGWCLLSSSVPEGMRPSMSSVR